MSGAARDAIRDAAWSKSKDCEHCQGSGMVQVFHPEYTGHPVIAFEDHDRGVIRVAGRAAAHCICDYGRWMRERTDQEMLKRVPDFQRCLDGESLYAAYDPTDPPDIAAARGLDTAAMAKRLGRGMCVPQRTNT